MGSVAYGQVGPCDPTVPVYNINLTGNPDSTWSQNNIVRSGTCCGYPDPPNSCVKFIVTLDPAAQAISFNVTGGALPANLQWQFMNASQTACDTTMHNANEAVCVTTPGPHVIIFCKPGGNNNTYSITSVPGPVNSPDISLNQGCSGEIFINGLIDSTTTWTSIAPGLPGDYNSYLSSTYGQDTVTVTPQVGFPPFVDFMVCGKQATNCNPITLCDTVRVYINSPLGVNITPNTQTICF